jgi:hypothetical protein
MHGSCKMRVVRLLSRDEMRGGQVFPFICNTRRTFEQTKQTPYSTNFCRHRLSGPQTVIDQRARSDRPKLHQILRNDAKIYDLAP